jgi:hypothetical protein
VLVIDGKNNNEPNLESEKMRNLRRDSGFQKCRRGPRDGLVGGAKVKTHEHLENLLSWRDQNSGGRAIVVIGSPIQRTNNHQIELMEG